MPEPPEPDNPEPDIKCLAVVRASSSELVRIAVYDLDRHAHLMIRGRPKTCWPTYADTVLVRIMNEPLRKGCGAAAMVGLEDEPSTAIARVRKIRAPAHVIIVTPRHGIFNDVKEIMDKLPELDMTVKAGRDRKGEE